MKEIYLDNAATTRVKKEVVKAMSEFFRERYGNASSVHGLGREASAALASARKKLAEELQVKPEEIYFTSGATEANNLAIFGLAKAHPNKKRILVGALEHPSVIQPALELKKREYEVVEIPVNCEGITDLEFLEKEIEKNHQKILLVCVMHVNNVIGSVNDIYKIGKFCAAKNVFFHTDAVQSFGKLKINVNAARISLLSASAHKIHGPKGVGLLYARKDVELLPMILGGGQERNIRSGTENIAGAVGFAKSLELMKKIDNRKIEKLRDYLMHELEKIGGVINGAKEKRIYNNVHVSFANVRGEDLVLALSEKRIYVSTGSACDNKKENDEKTLEKIGAPNGEAIRITLSDENSVRDIKKAAEEIKFAVGKLQLHKTLQTKRI